MSISLDSVTQHDAAVRPYLRLWAEVMRGGVQDFCTARALARPNIDPRINWMWSNDVFPGSFIWLCDLFDLEPEKARSQVLLQWRVHVDKRQVHNTRGKTDE